MDRSITIVDVAALAGVSVTTVSRIINNVDYPVAIKTRDKVLAAIKELNYSPNKAAQGIKKKFSDIIGLIVRDISDSYFGEIAKGVTDRASELGYLSFVCNTGRNPHDELKYHDLLWQHRVKGIILAGGGFNQADYKEKLLKQMERHAEYGLRIIALAPQGIDIPHVMISDFEAGKKITQYMIEHGHRKIGFIGGPQEIFTSIERFKGYKYIMLSNGVNFSNLYMDSDNFSQSGGYKACTELLKRENGITALCCANDNIAVGAMGAIHDNGLKIPDDISVISIGDMSEAKYLNPPLTSLKIPHYKMGEMAVNYIVQKSSMADVILETSIIERKSVKKIYMK